MRKPSFPSTPLRAETTRAPRSRHSAAFLRLVIVAVLVSLPLSAAFAALKKGARVGTRVSFVTGDGVRISGLYYPPAAASRKIFILLHGLGSNQEEWQPFVRKLIQNGYGFLSYDARGHGESTADASGKRIITYETFGNGGPGSPWSMMAADLEDAVKFLKTGKQIAEPRIGLIGASLGANVCLLYGASHASVPMVILLSPGLDYAGLGTDPVITAYRDRPLFIAASPRDTYAYQSSLLLYQKVQDNKRAVFFTGVEARHGVQMFDGGFEARLLRWINAGGR